MKRILEFIKKHDACVEGYKWSKQFDDPSAWWDAFDRGDWMLWVIGHTVGPPESASRKKFVLTACQCARLALPYVQKGENRPLKAVETAEAWARGENNILLSDVRAAAYAAVHAAADAAHAAHAVTHAAVYAAANAAANAVYAAAYAAYAADAAVYAADAANAADAAVKKQIADIVRENYKIDDILAAISAAESE